MIRVGQIWTDKLDGERVKVTNIDVSGMVTLRTIRRPDWWSQGRSFDVGWQESWGKEDLDHFFLTYKLDEVEKIRETLERYEI